MKTASPFFPTSGSARIRSSCLIAVLALGLALGPAAAHEQPPWWHHEVFGPSILLSDPPWERPSYGPENIVRSGSGDVPLGGTNEPTIAVDPANPLNVACASLREIRVSTDGGVTFQPPVFFEFPPSHTGGGDPSLAFDSQGRLFWTYIGVAIDPNGIGNVGLDIFIAQCEPTTGEILGGYPVNVTAATGLPGIDGNFHDKEWLAADTYVASPFTDRLYITWTRFLDNGNTRVFSTYSTDQGASWSPRVRLDGANAVEGFKWPAHNTVAPNGDVYVAYHSQPTFVGGAPDGITGSVYVLRSTDGGNTYPQKTQAYQPGEADMTFNVQGASSGVIPGAHFWLQGSVQPWLLADPNDASRIHVVANDDPDNDVNSDDAADVFIATSNDSGVTWGVPIRVDDGPGTTFQVMPTAAIDPVSGVIAVHYYDIRSGNVNSDGNFLLDLIATKSHDGGNTFHSEFQINDDPFDPDRGAPCRLGCGTGLVDVWAASADTVFVSGDGGVMLHTSNGGSVWTSEATGTNSGLKGVWGTSGSDVFVVGLSGTILHYDGNAWSSQPSGSAQHLVTVWGASSDTVFAAGYSGTLLRTFDGGQTWSSQTSGTTEVLTCIWGSSFNDIFVVGKNGTILHSTDGGNTWIGQSSGTDEILKWVWGATSDSVFAVGWNGGIYFYDGNVWSPQTSGITTRLYAVWGTAASDVFAVGDDGRILHYDGSSWASMPRLAGRLRGLHGSSGNDVFTAGGNGQIYYYDGNSWLAQDNPARPTNPTQRIGEYNGVSVGGGFMRIVWCGNTTDMLGDPLSQQIMFDGIDVVTGVGPVITTLDPSRLLLERSAPNPFAVVTTIDYVLPAAGSAHLALYDLHGRRVASLMDRVQAAGRHSVSWDGHNSAGRKIAPGVYFLRLESGDEVATRKVVVRR